MGDQGELWDGASKPIIPSFDGRTYQDCHDRKRLSSLLARVERLMSDACWRTLAEIQSEVGGSEAGISARLRDLRKTKFGGYQVDRRRRGEGSRGLWEYRTTRKRSAQNA